MGLGCGDGQGMGRGRGREYRRWQIPEPNTPPPVTSPQTISTPTMSKKEKVQMLENQAEAMEQQLGQIKRRLKELRK